MVSGILVAFSAAAVCMDLKQGKIDNRWIALGWIMGFCYQVNQQGLSGTGTFLAGITVPVVCLYFLFYLRMLGAGDIKLLSVLGGFMGVKASVVCIIWSFVFGAVLSLGILILCGNMTSRLRYFTDYFIQLLKTGTVVPYRKKGHRMEHMHFSVAVFMGLLLYVGGMY